MENQELHLARGNAAKELLKSEAFMVATNELVNGYVGGIVNSQPDAAKERESLYAHVKAVQDIVGMLNQWVSVAAQIRMAQEEQADEE